MEKLVGENRLWVKSKSKLYIAGVNEKCHRIWTRGITSGLGRPGAVNCWRGGEYTRK